MSTRFQFATRRAAKLLNLAACIVSMLMLLTFPLERVHQYTNHLRSPEIRRTIERHTFVAHSEAGTAERIANQAVMPAILESVETWDAVKPVVDFKLSPQVPISHLLARLKLGTAHSGGQDPLL
jgi:hypothetical protein